MNSCEALKGFLTLSGCENPAVTACSNCGRSMCSAHLAPQSGFSMCFDCAATNADVQEGEYDGVWSNRYRSSYYASTGYAPMDWSSRHDDYDEQDVRSFDERERDAAEDEVERGGFDES
jgi:hypothetical protein